MGQARRSIAMCLMLGFFVDGCWGGTTTLNVTDRRYARVTADLTCELKSPEKNQSHGYCGISLSNLNIDRLKPGATGTSLCSMGVPWNNSTWNAPSGNVRCRYDMDKKEKEVVMRTKADIVIYKDDVVAGSDGAKIQSHAEWYMNWSARPRITGTIRIGGQTYDASDVGGSHGYALGAYITIPESAWSGGDGGARSITLTYPDAIKLHENDTVSLLKTTETVVVSVQHNLPYVTVRNNGWKVEPGEYVHVDHELTVTAAGHPIGVTGGSITLNVSTV